MGLIKNYRLGKQLNKRGFQTISDLDRIIEGNGGIKTSAGLNVSESTAINYSAVFNAVWIISNTIASLPLILYKRIDDFNKKRYPRHELYDLLHNRPNSEMTSYVWREISQVHLLLWGNAYSQIIRTRGGAVNSLWPLNPQRVQVKRENGKLVYIFRNSESREIRYKPEQILHIPGFGFDGRVGKSVIGMARESIGLGLATEKFGGQFFGNGAKPSGVLYYPGRLDEKSGAAKRIREDWDKVYNSNKTILLEEGMKYEPITMKPEDAQFLGTRKFQITEIARWFNLPPHKIKDLEHATYSNIEEMQMEFVQDSIRPWLERWESYLNWKLLNDFERKTLFTEFLMDALLRGNITARYSAYSVARQNGIINANEWRAKENMNKQDGEQGDIYWMPLNMTDASQSGSTEPIIGKPFEGNPPEEKTNSSGLEKRLLAKGLEKRSIRSIQLRRKYAGRYKKLFRTTTNTIISMERESIMKIAEQSFKERGFEDFRRNIDNWYVENKDKIKTLFAGAIRSYADDILKVAQDEVGYSKLDEIERDEYVNGYVDITAGRYVDSSRGQIKSEARKAEEKEEDPIKAIDKRITEWEAKRPDKVADREVIDGEGAFSQYVYFSAGMGSRWVAISESCPYCLEMDGKIISRGSSYFTKGDVLEPMGAVHGPLIMGGTVKHPALHAGCDCTIIGV